MESYVQAVQDCPGGKSAQLEGLLQDVTGQVREALSRRDWYDKWGKHYLPSLRFAHQLQQCNNFKDPGVQFYGSALFQTLRDEADDIFCQLPPPVPSLRVYSRGSAPSRPIDMSAYNNCNNACFDGASAILLAGGATKRVDSIRRGDTVLSGGGRPARVQCVVQTLMAHGTADLVELSPGLRLTPWHPVKVDGRWAFPADLQARAARPCEAVYSLVLDSEHTVCIGGVECVTLGHGLEGEVVGHAYLGTGEVVRDLRQLSGWEAGWIAFKEGCMIRSPETGLIVGFDSRKVVRREETKEVSAAGCGGGKDDDGRVMMGGRQLVDGAVH